MFVVMNVLLDMNDEVIVPTPSYQPLISIPEAIGCKVKLWQLHPEQQFVPDLQELKRMITADTRMVIVNFPNNPTGATLTVEQLDELIEVVSEVNAYLLWDSAFTELSYTAPPLPDPGLKYKRTITLGTLSKTYGLGGLRVGWGIVGADVLDACVNMRSYITVNLSPLIEYIAQPVVKNLDQFVSIRFQQAQINLAIVAEWVEEHKGIVDWVRPQGGVTAFIKIAAILDIEAFCRRFAHDYSVFLLPGTCFGYPEYIRLGFGGPTWALREGLSRLSKFLITEVA